MDDGTVLGHLPTLQPVADAAVVAASDRAGAMTGTIGEPSRRGCTLERGADRHPGRGCRSAAVPVSGEPA